MPVAPQRLFEFQMNRPGAHTKMIVFAPNAGVSHFDVFSWFSHYSKQMSPLLAAPAHHIWVRKNSRRQSDRHRQQPHDTDDRSLFEKRNKSFMNENKQQDTVRKPKGKAFFSKAPRQIETI